MRYVPVLLVLIFVSWSAWSAAFADDRVDLIPRASDESTAEQSIYVLEAAWECSDPWGEFDPSLGAAGALNRALGLYFSGHATEEQIEMERGMVASRDPERSRAGGFAFEVLSELERLFPASVPEPVELHPFDLSPSELPVVLPDDSHLVAVRYDDEEYLERLLQRLYFKLIQGPVLLTVPYQAEGETVPEEFRDWRNFRFGSNGSTMDWNDVRLVWVDWELTQTVVLSYEDGRIACYDRGKKYYIDHPAAVAAAGAMLAHPNITELAGGGAIHFVLSPPREE